MIEIVFTGHRETFHSIFFGIFKKSKNFGLSTVSSLLPFSQVTYMCPEEFIQPKTTKFRKTLSFLEFALKIIFVISKFWFNVSRRMSWVEKSEKSNVKTFSPEDDGLFNLRAKILS